MCICLFDSIKCDYNVMVFYCGDKNSHFDMTELRINNRRQRSDIFVEHSTIDVPVTTRCILETCVETHYNIILLVVLVRQVL